MSKEFDVAVTALMHAGDALKSAGEAFISAGEAFKGTVHTALNVVRKNGGNKRKRK